MLYLRNHAIHFFCIFTKAQTSPGKITSSPHSLGSTGVDILGDLVQTKYRPRLENSFLCAFVSGTESLAALGGWVQMLERSSSFTTVLVLSPCVGYLPHFWQSGTSVLPLPHPASHFLWPPPTTVLLRRESVVSSCENPTGFHITIIISNQVSCLDFMKGKKAMWW